jgi:hypothetical protein
MASPRHPRIHIDTDGVRTTTSSRVRPAVWLVVAVLSVLGAALFLAMRPRQVERIDQTATRRVAESARRRDANAPAPPRAQRDRASRVQLPARSEAIDDRAHAEAAAEAAADPNAVEGDAPTGIALFPPPGTDPIKPGILVPEDFELPPGYLRHYQVTDDGKPLPAILMFHPDYHPVDPQGVPIALPADRVVPPDMAPPGLPIEMLALPDDPVLEGPDDAVKNEPAP